MTRLLAAACVLAFLALPRGAAADRSDEFETRSWEESHRLGIQASRLSVSIGSVNVFMLSFGGGLWLSSGHLQSTEARRRAVYAIGSTQVAGAIANLVWLVYAGETLRDYKQRAGQLMTVRRARLDTAFAGIDTAFRLAGTAGGIVALARHRTLDFDVNASRSTGLFFVIPNLAVLPFHIWALVANAKELHYRKHAREWTRRPRVEPIPSGFRF